MVLTASANAGIPKTELRAGGHTQRGGLVWEDWTSGDGHPCVAESGDGPGTFPKPLRVSRGRHRARFVLLRRQRPAAVKITAWRRLDSDGSGSGRGERLARVLRPRRDSRGRVVAWTARFSVHLPPRYYLRLYVRWPNGRCGGPRHVLRTYSIAARTGG